MSGEDSYEFWLGPRELKYSSFGVERSVRPSATIRRARAVLDTIGVTTVADITDLDRVGIPNFMTVRPEDLGISYYNGKGTTRAQAHAGALMEAVERHGGERYEGPVIASSYYNLSETHACVDPLEIHAPMVRKYSEDSLLDWVLGYDLMTRRPTFAPLNCVVFPYRPSSGLHQFFTSTNGLASGNTRVDALCHALCEVIERDATALAMARADVKPAVTGILADIGFGAELSTEQEKAPLISLRRLPRQAAALLAKLRRAGLDVQLRNLTSAVGVPTIDCTITESEASPGAPNAHGGCGTHPDARIALTRALTEAAQSRLSWIQGGREDLPDFVRTTGTSASHAECESGDKISFDDIPSYEHASVSDDVEFLIERMRQSGFAQVVVFDLTRPEVGIPVVRVIVPGAEAWTLFFAHSGRARLGPRALQQIVARSKQ